MDIDQPFNVVDLRRLLARLDERTCRAKVVDLNVERKKRAVRTSTARQPERPDRESLSEPVFDK